MLRLVDEITAYITQHLLLMVLVMTRLSTLLMVMPAVGMGVPKRIRAMLAVLLTFLIAPSVIAIDPNYRPPALNNIDLSILLAREAVIGLFIGTVIQFVITGVQTAGEIMTGTGGMQLGDSIDPTTSSAMPTLARLIGMLVVAIMIGIGGHRMILSSLIESFQSMPPGRVVLHDSMMTLITTQLGLSLGSGIRVSAPVVVAMLLCNLVTGLISRTLPQINVLAIGLSINSIAILAVAALSIGSASYVFQAEFGGAITRLGDLWVEVAR